MLLNLQTYKVLFILHILFCSCCCLKPPSHLLYSLTQFNILSSSSSAELPEICFVLSKTRASMKLPISLTTALSPPPLPYHSNRCMYIGSFILFLSNLELNRQIHKHNLKVFFYITQNGGDSPQENRTKERNSNNPPPSHPVQLSAML